MIPLREIESAEVAVLAGQSVDAHVNIWNLIPNGGHARDSNCHWFWAYLVDWMDDRDSTWWNARQVVAILKDGRWLFKSSRWV